MPVTVTESAAREIAAIIKQQDLNPESICLRVGVKGGGCSGFSYLLDLTEAQKETDEVWEQTYSVPSRNGNAETETGGVATEKQTFTLKVICDPKSYLYLEGTEIDFKDELMGRGFVFNNPNATSSCGCGSSFTA